LQAALYHSFDKLFFRRFEHDDLDACDGKLLEKSVERLGLGKSPWEAIEKESPAFGLIFYENFADEPDDDFIRHEPAALDEFFRFKPKRRTVLDGGTEHIAGGDVMKIVMVTQEFCLRSFADTRRSE
jgi:hypothetical protein